MDGPGLESALPPPSPPPPSPPPTPPEEVVAAKVWEWLPPELQTRIISNTGERRIRDYDIVMYDKVDADDSPEWRTFAKEKVMHTVRGIQLQSGDV